MTNISIIIPLYNCEKYICRCLNSIVKQTYKNLEVIIVNDGSKDNSEKVCLDFINEKKLSNFHYFYKNNGGVSSARNFGISKASGDWLMFVDADDFLDEICLEKLCSAIDINSEMVVGNFATYYSNGKKVRSPFVSPKKNQKKSYLLNILNEKISSNYEYNLYKASRAVWAKLYNKKIINSNKMIFNENIKLFEDGLFNLIYVNKINNINFVNEVVYYYFENNESATKKYYPSRFEDDKYKILQVESVLDNDSEEILIAKQLFYYNLFISSLDKCLFHKLNNQPNYKKKEMLKVVIREHYYKNLFNKRIFKFLGLKQKIIFILLYFRLYTLTIVLFNFRNFLEGARK